MSSEPTPPPPPSRDPSRPADASPPASTPPSAGPASASPSPPPREPRTRPGLHLAEYTFVGLMLMSLLGIALTESKPEWGLWYWFAMAPLFGGVYVFLRWPHLPPEQGLRRRLVWQQLLHWGGVLGAVFIVFALQQAAAFPPDQAALVVLLILALASFLAGLHGGWRFAAMGVLLGLLVLGATLLEGNPWLVILIGVILTVAVFFVSRWLRRSPAQEKSIKPTS